MIWINELFPGLDVAYSTVSDGSMRDVSKINEVLVPYIQDRKVVHTNVAHGVKRRWITQAQHADHIGDEDVLNTTSSQVVLTLRLGDCAPVVLYDPHTKRLSLVHAGWRSLLQGVIELAVHDLRLANAEVSRMQVWIGPSLQKDSNQCGNPELWQSLPGWKQFVHTKDGANYLDMQGFIQKNLEEIGVQKEHIINSREDTFTQEHKYYSHRRDSVKKNVENGRFVVSTWMRG